ncbi:MAG: hypothetical protein WC712_02210 [Candidatus Brocadiia bacterium]
MYHVYAGIVALYALLIAFSSSVALPHIHGTYMTTVNILFPVAIYCAIRWRPVVSILLVFAGYLGHDLIWMGTASAAIYDSIGWHYSPDVISVFSTCLTLGNILFALILSSATIFACIVIALKYIPDRWHALRACIVAAVLFYLAQFLYVSQMYQQLCSALAEPQIMLWGYAKCSVDVLLLNLGASFAVFLFYRSCLKPKVAYPLAVGIFLVSFLITPATSLFVPSFRDPGISNIPTATPGPGPFGN